MPLTAEDFVWSYRRMLRPELAAEYSGMLFLLKNGREVYEQTKEPGSWGRGRWTGGPSN